MSEEAQSRHRPQTPKMPMISIVIPHYNRVGLLMETLDSIKAQDHANWEVLVVDDGSDDRQWTELKELVAERIRILRRTDGIKGPSRCRNLGAAESSGDFLVFIDSDDIVAPWCLSQRLSKLLEEPEADLWVFPVMLFRKHPGDLAVCWNRLEGDDDLERFLRSDPPWHTSSPIWRREAFQSIGGFNEEVMYGDDAELHTRTLLKGAVCRKFADRLPDVFIRRSEEKRITNASLSSLLASRQVRLAEGSRLLRERNAGRDLADLWEGQYFVECEELLFNVRGAGRQCIVDVIDAWVEQYRPSRWRRWFVRSYFRTGSLLRDHAYWAIRIARRMAKIALPGAYFPHGGHFQRWTISAETARVIQKGLNFDVAKLPSPSQVTTEHAIPNK